MGLWLDVVPEATGNVLLDTGRLESLIEELPDPRAQYPSLIWFAGNENRVKALQALFPHNNITRRGQTGFSRIHISTHTAHADNPILVAESNIFNDSGAGQSKRCRFPAEISRRYPICQGRRLEDVRQHLNVNAFLAWTHVLCIFVDTPAEMRKALEMIESPRRRIRVGSRPTPGCLHIVVVRTFDQKKGAMFDTNQSHLKLSDESPNKVIWVDLRQRFMLSAKAYFEPLRKVLLDQVEAARAEKLEKGILFSGWHLKVLWRRTLDSMMKTPEEPAIDCLQVAREGLELKCATEHLARFLDLASNLKCTPVDVHRFIATALLMNAYPPGMHSKP